MEISISVKEFKGVKLVLNYEMKNAKTQDLVLIGKTKHCFVNDENKPIILKKTFPDFDKKLKELVGVTF